MKVIDTYMLYSFVRKLSTPFNEWKAYELGVIDRDGNFIIAKEDRTPEQANSFSYFDLLILNIKKALAKIPGGSSRIATFAAALYMLREGHNPQSEKRVEILSENFENTYTSFIAEALKLVEDEGGGRTMAVNTMGSGAVADPQAPMSRKLLSRQKKQAKFKSKRRAKR